MGSWSEKTQAFVHIQNPRLMNAFKILMIFFFLSNARRWINLVFFDRDTCELFHMKWNFFKLYIVSGICGTFSGTNVDDVALYTSTQRSLTCLMTGWDKGEDKQKPWNFVKVSLFLGIIFAFVGCLWENSFAEVDVRVLTIFFQKLP